MGGFGSGRPGGRGRSDVATCLQLDVRALKRAGFLRSGQRPGAWQWATPAGERAWISFVAGASGVAFDYLLSGERVRYVVPIEWTSATLGGRVPWFRCPGAGCGKRCAILYLAGALFACRACSGLAYACQNETSLDRLQRKRRKAVGCLANDPDEEASPRRPKGMHRTTFKRLLARAESAELEWQWAFTKRWSKIVFDVAQRSAAAEAPAGTNPKFPLTGSRGMIVAFAPVDQEPAHGASNAKTYRRRRTER